jgi:hypothetical protein
MLEPGIFGSHVYTLPGSRIRTAPRRHEETQRLLNVLHRRHSALQVHLFIADPSLSNDGREIKFPSLSKRKSVFLSDQSLTVACDILAIAIPAASSDFHARTAGSRYTATSDLTRLSG